MRMAQQNDTSWDQNKLVIVSDEKRMTFANNLMAMIGQKDDDGDKIIGIKDGSVKAAIFTPKHYQDNLFRVSSDQPVIFIGDFKEANDCAKGLSCQLNMHGMHFGWLGNRAVMYVDKVKRSKKDDYEEFLLFANSYYSDCENKISATKEGAKTAVMGAGIAGVTAGVVGVGVAAAAILNPVVALLTFAIAPTSALSLFDAGKNWLKLNTNEKILTQKYSCLTAVVYLDYLRAFLEG